MTRQFKDFLDAKAKLENAGLYKGLVAFGSARISMDDAHIKEIEEIADLCAKRILEKGKKISFITGGGPSVMTAWLKGAYREGIQTSGLFMQLMKEKVLNPYAIPEISCEVETLESRKAILFEYAKCAIIFKGGFGTLDEVFSMLTLIRTGNMQSVQMFVYPADFYQDTLNFKELLKVGTINQNEADMLKFFDKKEDLLQELYKIIDAG